MKLLPISKNLTALQKMLLYLLEKLWGVTAIEIVKIGDTGEYLKVTTVTVL